jgi:class 3 adenylate cyclase
MKASDPTTGFRLPKTMLTTLDAFSGREVKHTGDGILAAFDEVANAVRAAADIQQRFAPNGI